MANIVAIVGRPNVGKSTLFNRLTESRKAIVDDISGVTRDRHYGKVEWNGVEFSLIDTGGYVEASDDIFEKEIRKQVRLAIDEANLILFVVDVEIGITDMDTEIKQMLKLTQKPVLLVVNKVDDSKRNQESYEFYNMGVGDYFSISSINGSGTGDLLDEVVKQLPKQEEITDINIPRFSIVGRPNVGKSSLVNTLIGEDRNIVTDIPGTTRDAIYIKYTKFNNEFYLVDTAGLRKKSKVSEDLEFYSVMRSVRAIENSDVCILMLDATQGIQSQDLSIFKLAVKNKKGIMILINKWDLIKDKEQQFQNMKEKTLSKLEPFNDIPVLFTSVKEKTRIYQALEKAIEIYHNRQQRINTSKLNQILLPYIEKNPPPAYKGKWIKIKYINQLPTLAPAFAFHCNLPQYIKDPYKRFIENKLRMHFNFTGVPISIFFRKK